jgi:hypothetical protein
VAFLALVAAAIGCARQTIRNREEVVGEYAFHYKTGEVEVFELRSDSRYRQELYQNSESYRRHGPVLHENSGLWSYETRKVILNDFMMFCQFPNPDVRLASPMRIADMRGYWQPPDRRGDASIWLSYDFHYVFLRVKNNDRSNEATP